MFQVKEDWLDNSHEAVHLADSLFCHFKLELHFFIRLVHVLLVLIENLV